MPVRDRFDPLDRFQQLSSIGTAQSNNSTPININPDEHAVVSSLYTDSYITAITTLGHSLQAANVRARMILMYVPGQLSPHSICRATAAGWTLHPVARVPPPHAGKGVLPHYKDQYTKLRIWTLDAIGIKTAVYLDADTLVRRNFDELFALPFNFAAVPDVFLDHRGFTIGFNAGVLLLRTSTAVFEDMLAKLDAAVYPPKFAEQAFLNVYFESQVARLPYAYNANLAIKSRNTQLWHAMARDMRIVHYTLYKPFPRTSSVQDSDTQATMREFFRGQMTLDGGFWAEEMGWWQESWRDMVVKTQNQCL
ncbi:nucleotide-diphospho-sugar transferase [Gautieria morchelliformis]|nr:nucleotide-diphospho-sugar transferase [Gautieria morchelliformis]